MNWNPIDFWELSLEKYRISKKIRKIINKNGKGFKFKELSEILNVSRDYIYQIMLMNIKPNREFIEKLNEIHK